MIRLSLPSLLLGLFALPATGQTLFSEDWDDGQGASRWSTPIVALETEGLGFDGSVDYDYDYTVLGAPSAPNSVGGTTTGVFMETNTTDQPGSEGESVGILPLNFSLPDTDFQLTADVFLYWNGGSGSTEYATLGIHHQGSDNVPLRFNENAGDGLAWQVDTDGDAVGSDVIGYQGPGGETLITGYAGIPDGSIPNVPTGGPSPVGPFNQWVELSITSTAGTVEFAMNGFVLDTFDNTGGAFTGGTLLIGQSDPFNSVNTGNPSNGVVFDNIVVASLNGGIPGDANGDGNVDLLDLDILGSDFGVVGESPADFNNDGTVDLLDLDILGANFGSGESTAVPEPTGLVALALGLGFAARRGSIWSDRR